MSDWYCHVMVLNSKNFKSIFSVFLLLVENQVKEILNESINDNTGLQ